MTATQHTLAQGCRQLCRPVWVRLLLCVGLLAGWTAHAAPPEAAELPIITSTQARVSHDQGSTWVDITLPDHWAQRGPQARAGAQYELGFDLAAQATVSTVPMAVSFSSISQHRRVSLNGHVVQQRGDGPDFRSRRASAPALIDLPPGLLRAGRNVLQVEVQHAGSGLLSAPAIGPADSLRRSHAQLELVYRDIPRALNQASLGLALFMLVVWLRRRSEVALGCFGALSLLMALRNLAYFADQSIASGGVGDWAFYTAQVASVVLLGAFAHAMASNGWRWHRRLLWGLALVLPLLAAVLAWQDHANMAERLDLRHAATRMGLLRRWSYPVLALAALPALVLLLRLAWQRRGGTLLLVALGVSAGVLAGVHDYAALQGRSVLADLFMLPFVAPVVLGTMSVFLVSRMVAATGAAESLAAELEQRVAERTQQLSQANLARARFLSAASHDLRQPVLTIGLLASLLPDADADADSDAAAPTRPGLVARLQAAVASMQRLLDGLLDLSRLDPLVVQARVQAVPLQKLWDGLAQHDQAAASARGLRLRLRPTNLVVQADPVLLEQILRNLVSNALRYTARGGVLVAARVTRSGAVRLQVWDTGIGMAPADQARVFDEFVQLHNPGRDRALGQGLGLAIAQRSAAAMGSSVVLRSVPGRGSCFSILLPCASDAASITATATATAHTAAADALAGTSVEQPLRGRVLWVLDDDAALRDAMVMRLQQWGAQVVPLASVAALHALLAEAVQARAVHPSLFMTDQRMPDGSGALAVRLVRDALGASLPCLLVTGDPEASDSRLLVQAGVPLLTKPFGMSALLQALGGALQSQGQG